MRGEQLYAMYLDKHALYHDALDPWYDLSDVVQCAWMDLAEELNDIIDATVASALESIS